MNAPIAPGRSRKLPCGVAPRPLAVGSLICLTFVAGFAMPSSAAAFAAEPAARGEGPSLADLVHKPLVVAFPGSAEIQPKRGILYAGEADSSRQADIYLPAPAAGVGPFPVVVLVHGGVPDAAPLRPRDWGFFQSWGRSLAASGFAAIAFDHRMSYPEPRLGEANADLAALLAWVQSRGAAERLDPRRIGVVFFSAGGALMAPLLAEPPSGVLALAALYPILDLDSMAHFRSAIPDAAQRRLWSPLAALERVPPAPAGGVSGAPPVFLVRAGQDAIPDLLPGLDRFAARGLERGVRIVVHNHPAGPHGFDNQDDSPESRRAVRAVFSFLDETVRGEPDLAARLSFQQYDPPSTLRAPEHPVARARHPFVDVHNHQWTQTLEHYQGLAKAMDAMNMAVMVNLSGRGFRRETGPDGKTTFALQEPEHLRRSIALAEQAAPGRFVFFTNVDFRGVGTAGWAEAAVAQLEADVAAGAKGLKIYKSLGMDSRDAGGQRIAVNDPRLDPIWAACGRLGIPVLIHTADPAPFWQPRDGRNERLFELLERPDRQRRPGDDPGFEALLAEQHDVFRRHPGTTFINAHLGWLGNDLARLGRLLDEMPNVMTEIGAVLAELGRQPRVARDWFVRYQDRVLFGKDSWAPEEYPPYFRTLETEDDYFPYYRRRHAFWKIYGLGLPDAVLRKLYYENALRLIPGIDRSRFPPGRGSR